MAGEGPTWRRQKLIGWGGELGVRMGVLSKGLTIIDTTAIAIDIDIAVDIVDVDGGQYPLSRSSSKRASLPFSESWP